MGAMDLATLRSSLRYMLGNRADLTDAQLDSWLYMGALHIAQPSVHRHRELQTSHTLTLAQGDDDYDISTSTIGFRFTALYSVTHVLATSVTPTARRRRLRAMAMRDMEELVKPEGAPYRYAVWGEVLYLDTSPSSTEASQKVVLRGWKEHPTLPASGAASPLRPYWDIPIIVAGAWHAWRALNRLDRAEILKQELAAVITEACEVGRVEAEDIGWEVTIDHGPVGVMR